MLDAAQIDPAQLDALDAEQLRALARQLLERTGRDAKGIVWRDAKIDKLTFEIAQLRRLQYSAKSEQFSAEQTALFDEAVSADIAAIEEQLAALQATLPPKPQDGDKQTPKRTALPAHLPRVQRHHEPEDTTCGWGCRMARIGEDVSEKLDYTPGVFTVERHVRGKWACAQCRTLVQAPMPAAVIDKGIPTAGLLAQVLVAKHADHLPLYRQEAIFGRAGLAIPRSTLAAWVGKSERSRRLKCVEMPPAMRTRSCRRREAPGDGRAGVERAVDLQPARIGRRAQQVAAEVNPASTSRRTAPSPAPPRSPSAETEPA